MPETITFDPPTKPSMKAGSLNINSEFGAYRIVELLGRGGMGDVYKAKHLKLDRYVALKVLPVVLSTPDFIERFNSEAFAISRLQHQNIVTIYDYGEIDHRRYIAMQYIRGETLCKIIERKKGLPEDEVINIGKQICRGLKYSHSKGIVHRDIKSGNVMLDSDGRAYISDFGIAQTPGGTRLTTTGMAMGTPEYMSPEQCQGHKIDFQSDIYSFGVVLFEMVCGKPPFMGENPLSIAYKQVHENPPLLSKLKKNVNPRLELIVAKCLKKNKEERYKDATELLKDMDSIKKASHSLPFSTSPQQKDTGPEKRITDRRSTDRRRVVQVKSARSFISLALLIFVLGFMGMWLANKFLDSRSQNSKWISPKSSQLLSDETSAEVKLDNLDLPILEGLNLAVQLKSQSLIMGLTLDLLPAPNAITGQQIILSLHSSGREQARLELAAIPGPQYLDLPDFIAENLEVKLENSLPEASQVKVKAIRLLAMPYE